MILAKPVVENQYWILKKDNRKIGQLEVKENGVIMADVIMAEKMSII